MHFKSIFPNPAWPIDHTRFKLPGIHSFKWKKYLLPMSVAFSVTYNLPKYFEMKIETVDDRATIVPTGERERSYATSIKK